MMQPTSVGERLGSAAGAGLDTVSPPPSSPTETDPQDARIAALHDALRSLVMGSRKVKHHDGDLDRGSIALLLLLDERQPTRASDLAACMGLDASTVSRHTKALIDAGYATTTSDPLDARARLLRVTSEGNTLLTDIRTRKIARSRNALSDWAPEDIDTLTTLLRRLSAALEHEDS